MPVAATRCTRCTTVVVACCGAVCFWHPRPLASLAAKGTTCVREPNSTAHCLSLCYFYLGWASSMCTTGHSFVWPCALLAGRAAHVKSIAIGCIGVVARARALLLPRGNDCVCTSEAYVTTSCLGVLHFRLIMQLLTPRFWQSNRGTWITLS